MLPCDIVLTTCKVGVKMIVSNLCAAKYFGKESIISVTPVIYNAMIDTTIVILDCDNDGLYFRVCRAPFAISDHFTMVADS